MSFWYQKSIWQIIFLPLHWLLSLFVYLRISAYRIGIFSSKRSQLPIIVVGNISVGGTGKSPLVVSLVHELKRLGYNPGIISRGYGGNAPNYPLEVYEDTPVKFSGDEAWMLARKCQCPVVVDPIRYRAADLLATTTHCDVIVSDDGLQHYPLQRQFEIAVIEGERYLGNGMLMPFGPLREPKWRLRSVDAIVINHRFDSFTQRSEILRQQGFPVYDYHFTAQQFVNLANPRLKMSLQAFIAKYRNETINAVAGIGNPEAFYEFLIGSGLSISKHSFPDHYQFEQSDLTFDNGMVIMTEKDATKCLDFDLDNVWYMAIDCHITPNITKHCIRKLAIKSTVSRENEV